MDEKHVDLGKATIRTYLGVSFNVLEPREEDIHPLDIAKALSQQCRFTGHTKPPYSVAEHSILVATLSPTKWKLAALLHDAAEAYLMDLPTPIKNLPEMKPYRDMEDKLQRLIYKRFGVDSEEVPPSVKKADHEAFKIEWNALMVPTEDAWSLLKPHTWEECATEFLKRLDLYSRELSSDAG